MRRARGCLNTGRLCACPSGFETVVRACVDIDECASGTHACAPTVIRLEHRGGYECAWGGLRRRRTGNDPTSARTARTTATSTPPAATRSAAGSAPASMASRAMAAPRARSSTLAWRAWTTATPTPRARRPSRRGLHRRLRGQRYDVHGSDECALGTDCHAHATCSNSRRFRLRVPRGYAGDGGSARPSSRRAGRRAARRGGAQAIAGVRRSTRRIVGGHRGARAARHARLRRPGVGLTSTSAEGLTSGSSSRSARPDASAFTCTRRSARARMGRGRRRLRPRRRRPDERVEAGGSLSRAA